MLASFPRLFVRLSCALFTVGALLSGASTFAAEPSLRVESAWLRATPAGAQVGAGYATLRNTGKTPRVVVGVETPVSASAQLHSMTHSDGMMRMRHLERLPVPAGGSVALAPNGNHLMLFGLHAPLVAGQRVPLSFVLDDGSRVTTDFVVRAAAP